MPKKAATYTVVSVRDGMLEAKCNLSLDKLNEWARGSAYDSTALVFEGQPISVALETVVRIGEPKPPRKPRAKKADAAPEGDTPKVKRGRKSNAEKAAAEVAAAIAKSNGTAVTP